MHNVLISLRIRLQNGESRPLRSESAVVLFSDISGFTKLSATLTPVQLVEIMDSIYRQFDNLVSEFELYKVQSTVTSTMLVASSGRLGPAASHLVLLVTPLYE